MHSPIPFLTRKLMHETRATMEDCREALCATIDFEAAKEAVLRATSTQGGLRTFSRSEVESLSAVFRSATPILFRSYAGAPERFSPEQVSMWDVLESHLGWGPKVNLIVHMMTVEEREAITGMTEPWEANWALRYSIWALTGGPQSIELVRVAADEVLCQVLLAIGQVP